MRIENLSFSYEDKQVFRGLTLELPDTGVTALSGPSGCGKTTLLRLIAGLELPDSGTVEVPESRHVAMMFQENRLLPDLSAREQLKLVSPKADADRWLQEVGLSGEEDSLPDALSGGMQRRLSLARCLCYCADKSLLLLDEPFTGVDPDRIESLTALIRGMGIPVIFSAHDAKSLEMADRVISLESTEHNRKNIG